MAGSGINLVNAPIKATLAGTVKETNTQ